MKIKCENCKTERKASDGTKLANKVCTTCGSFGTLTKAQ